MRRPQSSLGDQPKEGEPTAATGMLRSLTVKITEAEYFRLKRFTVSAEAHSGVCVTHQNVIETALREYLDRHKG